MAFLDSLKEVGAKGLDKAKEVGELGKLKFDKAGAENEIKAIYTEVGQMLIEKFPEFFNENFGDQVAKLGEIKAKIADLEAAITAVKEDK